MKRHLLFAALLIIVSGSAFAQTTVTITDEDLGTGNYYWTSDKEYILDGIVFLEAGGKLFIEPGTVIKGAEGTGNEASGLVITRGAQIYAEGTADNPIIFTSVLDDGSLTYSDRGLWGGVVLLGRAITNNATEKAIEGVNELVGEGDTRANYGGNNDDDNSGVMRYVSIRHTGIAVGDVAGNEIQGLTLGGVGRGTTIEYVESYASGDDCFEWFGGSVDAKYLIGAFCSDDAFDFDEGFRGRGQFWFAIQGVDEAGRIMEMDGATGNENGTPYGSPKLVNLTLIGDGIDNTGIVGDGDEAVIFRDNIGGWLYNSIITDFAGQEGLAITVEDIDNTGSKPLDSRQRLEAGDLDIAFNIWYGFAAGNTVAEFAPQDFMQTYLAGSNQEVKDPQLRGISRETDGGLDPRPTAETFNPAIAFHTSSLKTVDDEWFDVVGYKGAFGAHNWAQGWSALSELGYFPAPTTTGSSGLEVTVTDATLGSGTYFWSADHTYILDGIVFLEAGGKLFIEPGTVIKGAEGTGNEASGLVITRGAEIYAEGTADNPIIFTSVLDDGSLTYSDRGLWGGVVLLGRATTNNATEKAIEGVNELVGEGDERANYGGNIDDDNSGVMRYVSIRHTGIAVGDVAGNEIQGLTLGGVGSGTTIEYVESYASGDDCFEWFGGTVDAKYLIGAFCSDDAFDFDEGFRGRGQFWFAIQGVDEAGRIMEMDGATGNENGTPYGSPKLVNLTLIGDGVDNTGIVGDGDEAVIFRDNIGGWLYNSIITDFAGQEGIAITVEDIDNSGSKPLDSRQRLEAGDLDIANNIWYGFAAGNAVAEFAPQDFMQTYLAGSNQVVADPQLRGISRETDGGLDPRPATDSPVNGATLKNLTDSWFDKVDYMGAFSYNNWAYGWSALHSEGYFGEGQMNVSTEDVRSELPSGYSLEQNYPNPFNPTTQISFTLPSAQNVKLDVYDMSGRLVATLVNGMRSAGVNTVTFDASNLSSGVYMYRLTGANVMLTNKMTLLK